MAHWLMKSEPEVFSIADLQKVGVTGWEGVRNYQARNSMRDSMRDGDTVLFYHSNAEPSGIAGVARVKGAPVVDPSQFDKKSEYYDAGSQREDPRWRMVNLEFVERFKNVVSLEALRAEPSLKTMLVLQRGQRLSVQPVEPKHFAKVLKLAKKG